MPHTLDTHSTCTTKVQRCEANDSSTKSILKHNNPESSHNTKPTKPGSTLYHHVAHLTGIDIPQRNKIVRPAIVHPAHRHVRLARVVQKPRGQIHQDVLLPPQLYRVRTRCRGRIGSLDVRMRVGGDDDRSVWVRAGRENSPLVGGDLLEANMSRAPAFGDSRVTLPVSDILE